MKIMEFPVTQPGSAPGARLTVYRQDSFPNALIKTRPLVLICPGGGYSFVSPREAEPIALAFVGKGFHAAVLTYSVAPARYPTALTELAWSVGHIRAHADEWAVDPAKIVVLGCSAGGHLAASLGVFWQENRLRDAAGVQDSRAIRPDGLILCYPVITSGEHRNIGSLEALLGQSPDPALWEKLSLEKRVTAQTPPSFVWHTFDDTLVPAENALLWAGAMKAAGVPCELHLYHHGAHGLSLCDARTANADGGGLEPACAGWVDLAAAWLQS